MNKDFLNILREIRGSGQPGTTYKDGIWYELTVADVNGNPGIYGDILAKYGIVTESAGTFDQAVAILENLNVEITTLPAGSDATSALVNGVWQIGIPKGLNGIDGNDGSTPELTMTYDSGNIKYTVSVDGVVVTNTNILDLDTLLDSKVSTNVGVQETLQAKQEVIDKVGEAQGLVDSLNQSVITKKQEIIDLTENKKQEILDEAEVQSEFVRDVGEEVIQELDEHALHRITQYDSNHYTKLATYNENDAIKMAQYNENHVERLENINYAYADRIIEMIKTRNFMGVLDEYVAQTATHMITFLDTTSSNYIYYANGNLLTKDLDYTVYDSKTIELTVKANPYDVIVQVHTRVLKQMLTAEGALFEDRLGQPNGVASLNELAQIPAEQLPSYVDDVLEFPTYADLPVEGETGKIYVVATDETSNGDTSTYRWTGTVYAMVSNTLNASDVKALYEANPDTNEYSDAEKVLVDVGQVLETTSTTLPTAINEVLNLLDAHKVSTGEDHTYIDQDVTIAATPTFAGIVTEGLVDGRDVSVDGAKLDTIEENAKDDQTGAEIKALYEAESDTNAYTDASVAKLDVDTALSTIATTLPTAINELKTAVDLNTAKQTNITTDLSYTAGVNDGTIVSSDGTDAVIPAADSTNAGLMLAVEKAKLNTIEEGATADQTATEIESLYESNIDTNKYTDAEKSRVAVSVSLQTTAQTLPDAINEIDSRLDYLNVSRADKVLASKDVANLIYSDGNLVKIRYTIDDDVDYEVLTYSGEDLTNVAHYLGGVLQGNTVLTYASDELVSSIFVGV